VRALPLILLFAALLSGCGFHLRGEGSYALPVDALYIQSPNNLSPFINELKQDIRAGGTKIADAQEAAPLTLQIVSEMRDKQILSLSVAGRVLEYRLQFKVSLKAYDAKGNEWLAPQEIVIRRDFSYDDTQILAKEQEEAQLYLNMQADAVQQVLRRLSRARPLDPEPKSKP
jgi:LPS-assembly lipoprotein